MKNLDLTNCDKEQIHLISSVQGHGALVAVTPLDMKIRHISENFLSFIERSEDSHLFVGSKLSEILPHDLVVKLQSKIRSLPVQSPPVSLTWGSFDIYLYMLKENLFAIEFENLGAVREDFDSQSVMQSYLTNMSKAKSVKELSFISCKTIRELTGFDRVMLYRFWAPSWDGEVTAEDKNVGAHSFMGHRFPASDIPKPARDLYLKNQVRQICDSHERSYLIYPQKTDEKEALDFSNSRLRAVSLVHLEYLKNMKVRGSFSVAVKVEGALWALIACHSEQPKQVPHSIRALCDTVANCLALSAPAMENALGKNNEIQFYERMLSIFSHLKNSSAPQDELFRMSDEVNNLFHSHGFALVKDNVVSSIGITPQIADIKSVAAWTLDQMNESGDPLFVSNSLGRIDQKWEYLKDHISGIAAVRLSGYDNAVLMFFRPEVLQTIQWGGDPRKNLDARQYQGVINPRTSFETWSEVIRYTSAPWEDHEIKGVVQFKELIFDSLIQTQNLISELGQKFKKN